MNKQLALLFLLVIFYQEGAAQNVGIGTSAPTRAKLEVHGAVDATSAIFGGENYGISLQRNWPAVGFNSYYNTGLHRLLSNGFGAVQLFDPNSGYMSFDMLTSGSAGQGTTLNRVLVISPDGRLNIGSGDAPPATLNVARGNAFDGTAVFQGTTHRSHFSYGTAENTYIRAGRDNGSVIINDIPGSTVALGGKVGINTITPGNALEVRQINNTPALVLMEPSNFNRWGLHVSSINGNMSLSNNGHNVGLFYAGSGNYGSISDKRLKTNIQSLPSLLDKVMQLHPVDYEMIHNNPAHKKTIGFIAQDVKKLFPELVNISTDTVQSKYTDLHTLDYSGFGVLAIKAIQEQQQVISELKQNNSSQQRLINELLQRVEKLESVLLRK